MNINKELYKKLYLSRRACNVIISEYPKDQMKTPMHTSYGQEHISVGVCAALKETDQIFTTYRGHAAYLAKTDDVEGFFAELYGKVSGCCRGKGGSMHLINPDKGHMGSSAIVASTLPVAMGAAFANKQLNNNKIVAVFFGDGAIEEGVFWETINFSTLHKLPIMFICENNKLAVHTHPDVRKGYKETELAQMLSCYDINFILEKEIDVRHVYDTINHVIRNIKYRPAFVLCECRRFLEHVGVNCDLKDGYREKDNLFEIDCVEVARSKLKNSDVSEIEEEINLRVEKAVAAAKLAEFPNKKELYNGVY